VSRVANRYTKALFELAVEEKKIEIVRSDFDMIESVLKESGQFSELIHNPLIPASQKARLMQQIFENKLDRLTYNFLILLCNKKRSDLLPEIIKKFYQKLLDYQGVITGLVISSQPIAQEQLESIHKKVSAGTGRKVQLSQEIDQSLLGGFIIKIKDTVIDLSVKNQLSKLRNKLIFG